jgi:hypothetical protein
MSLFAFDPLLNVQLYGIRIDQTLEGIRGLRFRHRVSRIRFSLNPLDFRDLSSFVSLVEAHYVDHESLFSCSS